MSEPVAVSAACTAAFNVFMDDQFRTEKKASGRWYQPIRQLRRSLAPADIKDGKLVYTLTDIGANLAFQNEAVIVQVSSCAYRQTVKTRRYNKDTGGFEEMPLPITDKLLESIHKWLTGYLINRTGEYYEHYRFLPGDGHEWQLAVQPTERDPITKNESLSVGKYIARWSECSSDDKRLAFVGNFATEWAVKENPINCCIDLLAGNEITNAYLKGVAFKSCMCGEYYYLTSMYAMNTDVCKLAVMYASDKKDVAIGRALLWITTADDGAVTWFLDRIYPESVAIHTQMREKVKAMAKAVKAGFKSPYSKDGKSLGELPPLRLKLCSKKFMPYMDSYRQAVLIEHAEEIIVFGNENTYMDWYAKHGCGLTLDKFGYQTPGKAIEGKVWVGSPPFTTYHTGGEQVKAQLPKFVPRPKDEKMKKETPNPKDVSPPVPPPPNERPLPNEQGEQPRPVEQERPNDVDNWERRLRAIYGNVPGVFAGQVEGERLRAANVQGMPRRIIDWQQMQARQHVPGQPLNMDQAGDYYRRYAEAQAGIAEQQRRPAGDVIPDVVQNVIAGFGDAIYHQYIAAAPGDVVQIQPVPAPPPAPVIEPPPLAAVLDDPFDDEDDIDLDGGDEFDFEDDYDDEDED